MTTVNTWSQIKEDFRGLFDRDTYQAWFESIDFGGESDGVVTLTVPNDFAAFWVEDNYADLITQRLQEAYGCDIELRLAVDEHAAEDGSNNLGAGGRNTTDRSTANTQSNRIQGSHLAPHSSGRSDSPSSKLSPNSTKAKDRYLINPNNTFENYVVGSGAQMAHACAIAVANSPARVYNPLFIYGDTGLGKTHLMHAVALHILKANPDAHVAYVPTEKFTNNFIRAIQEGTLVKFRRRYRRADVLLIDDIHFLSGKERSQEEIFHTFNELYESQKQIIIASDRPANEIAKLENRLVSRFGWGMVADIQPPDLETRQAILAKKAKSMNLRISDDILHFLAERVPKNVRRMEGALTRVGTYQAMTSSSLDVRSVEHLLQDILQEEAQQQVTIDKIQKRVADHYQLRIADMTSKRRPAHIAFPRQVAMYLSRILTNNSLQEIGESFGGRDHGTVIHAIKTVENMSEMDENVRRSVEYLKKNLADRR